ncbi:ABC transporter ATP-binding protein [Pseudonocardia thermophila]|uniref:ABC transporter ATP-binding protein n=1 Tax=Pseudonocardia thermophila TaxID=1848 RepID=UPI00248F4460|nr:ABC transporter ATP-binding protein [Pseudonocardia thermophila]
MPLRLPLRPRTAPSTQADPTDTGVRITGMTKSFGGATAVKDLSLTIRRGEFLVLVGPSGCGKTTTMRSIAGLETPDRGRIDIEGEVVFDAAAGLDVAPNKRNVGLVFQSYAIWPHRTVAENVAFPLMVRKLPTAEIAARTAEVLGVFGLQDFADRGASQLSGGQMQRVALARSIVMNPRVLLLDEPLSNLDAKLRERLRSEIKRTQRRFGTTTVHVTHDQAEALAIADRIAVMRDGRIEQIGEPTEIYREPRNRFVADFMGACNLIDVELLDADSRRAIVRLPTGQLLEAHPPAEDLPAYTLCVRPEALRLTAVDPTAIDPAALVATVELVSFMGNHFAYELRLPDGTPLLATGEATTPVANAGEPVLVEVDPSDALIIGP